MTVNPQNVAALGFIPLSPTDFQVLLALSRESLHGYGIMKTVEDVSGGRVRVEIGSLYRIVARLLASGLIEEDQEAESVVHAGKQRRCYRITAVGLSVARAETNRLRDAVAQADALLEGPEAST